MRLHNLFILEKIENFLSEKGLSIFMKKIVVAAVTIGLLLVLSLAVAQPWITLGSTPKNAIPSSYANIDIAITQTFLEGQAPSSPPGGYVKLRGLDVNPYVPDDCILTIYDATFSNFGDDVARCDFCGRNEAGTAVFRNQVLFIGPKETLALSFPEGRFLMEGGYVEAGCLEGGAVLVSVNGHLECWKGFEESNEKPGSSTDVQPGFTLP